MNEEHKKNIRRVARAIATAELSTREKDPIGFNMAHWIEYCGTDEDQTGHGCGTTACIAGWTHLLLGRVDTSMVGMHTKSFARKKLGLGPAVTEQLFYTGSLNPTNCQAAATLYHLADTGVVDWSAPAKKRNKDGEVVP